MVDGVGLGEDDLGDRDKGISLLEKRLKDTGQGLGRVEGGVVEQDDRPGLDPLHHPLCDFAGGEVLPVQAVHIPLDGLHADRADGRDHVVVVFAVGRADEGGAHAGDGLNFVVAGLHIGDDLLPGEFGHMGVGVGVVHHLMARIGEGLYRFRVFVHPVAYHEEGGLYVVLGQDVDEHLGVLVAPW